MKNPFSYYTVLAKRWAWMVILGIILCSSASYGISKITHPVYQASATLNLNLGTSSSPYENFTVSVQAVPTYAQLLISPTVLGPVVKRHPGLTLKQLMAMITVKPQTNTTLIELDVENRDPRLARDLANEVSESFVQFVNGTVQVLPAQIPTDPVRPKTLENTGIGALVGLGLALALIVIFEWIDDRPKRSEEVQELLGAELLTVFPWLSRGERTKRAEEIPALAEGYRLLAADLDLAQKVKPFKLVMVTSALAGEGKSSIATNLASFLAMAGKQILLVDANLSSPALDHHFEPEKRPEPGSAFTEAWAVFFTLSYDQTDIPNLHVLRAEVLPSNFMGLLPTPRGNQFLERLQKAPFDYVIFDTPPLLPAADTQILASSVQAIVLVVDPSKTPRKLLLRVKHLLDRLRTPVVGVVINKSRWPEHREIRQYLKDARHHRRAIPATPRPPETPSVNDQGEQDNTVIPSPMMRLPETPSKNGQGEQDLTVVLPPMPDRLKHLLMSDLMGQDLTIVLPRLKPPKEDQS
jgi:polysaccharide biosynthesis transport protein